MILCDAITPNVRFVYFCNLLLKEKLWVRSGIWKMYLKLKKEENLALGKISDIWFSVLPFLHVCSVQLSSIHGTFIVFKGHSVIWDVGL